LFKNYIWVETWDVAVAKALCNYILKYEWMTDEQKKMVCEYFKMDLLQKNKLVISGEKEYLYINGQWRSLPHKLVGSLSRSSMSYQITIISNMMADI
jgi:hypothetical protein